jgi:hypothetical protein
MPKRSDPGGREHWTRIVYVIELDPAACADRRSACDGDCGKTPVYVGQTARTAEERLAQHLEGYKASPWVKKYGQHLRADLADGYDEMPTVEESQAAEAELAKALRIDGRFCVYGGH